MEFGFLLTGLRLTGPSVEPAEVRFTDGLNAITGASDTGKTYILQCIDYLLGAGSAPKAIPEAEHYQSAFLGIRTLHDEREFVLQRGLRGGGMYVFEGAFDDELDSERRQALRTSHDANRDDNISVFLLTLSGLKGRVLRKNRHGVTRTLSFRDLAKLIVVDEERIIAERSPIHTGQYVTKTAETSAFRMLLTGVDDSGVVEEEQPAVTRSRREAQVEVLDELIEKASEEFDQLELDAEASVVPELLAAAEVRFDSAAEAASADMADLTDAETRRKEAWRDLKRCESRMGVLDELLGRFELLREHYISDLGRLDAVAEAGYVLDQIEAERCPFCGAPSDWQEHEHVDGDEAESVQRSCEAEAQKIHALLADLESTMAGTRDERTSLEQEHRALGGQLRQIADRLERELQPRVRASGAELKEHQRVRDRVRRAADLLARVEELEERKQEVIDGSPPTPRPPAAPVGLGADEVESFCQVVQELLEAWNFPELERVVFSEQDEDLVISGRRRASHGKGIRALTHAAFTIGLQRYCAERRRPHPGLVILDSPLVAYREPDVAEEEGLGLEVKRAFFASLARGDAHGQVIVLDNQDPPDEVRDGINYIHFTKSSEGRYGFIPGGPAGEAG